MEGRGRHTWGGAVGDAVGGAVNRVVSAAVDETLADDAGLTVIREGERSASEADDTIVLPRGAGRGSSGVSGGSSSADRSADQRAREAAMQARIEESLRERAALHQTVEYRRQRAQSKRTMTRAQKVYGRKWYLTRDQLVVAGAAWVGTALVLGSAVGGFWIWFIEATGVCR